MKHLPDFPVCRSSNLIANLNYLRSFKINHSMVVDLICLGYWASGFFFLSIQVILGSQY